MPNFIQKGIQDAVIWAFGAKDKYEIDYQNRLKEITELIAYYYGQHKRPLKLQAGKDYNVISNHIKTIVDRSVSSLVGQEVTFDLPGEGDSPEQQFIDGVWKANKKQILLHDVAQFGTIYGTEFIKIVPRGIVDNTGTITYRLVALNPLNVIIVTANDDIDNVLAYVYRWNEGDTHRREVTEKTELGTWTVVTQEMDRAGKWQNVAPPIAWPYPFAPIVHGKNLPNAGNVYGYSDIEGIIELQDRYNEGQSNENKILALQAFAQKYVVNGKWPRAKDEFGNEYIDVGPDKALEIKGDGVTNASVGLLEPAGDMTASQAFLNSVRRDMFEIAATVDSETVKDKVGTLTNFGLRVLFKNELAKNNTKQLLYGEFLLDVNLRLLVLEGMNPDSGDVIFGDPLPEDTKEVIENLTAENALGITSKQTIAKELGRDWEVEQERLAQEKQTSDNVGANAIRNFLAGK